jgi:hypothetical protein
MGWFGFSLYPIFRVGGVSWGVFEGDISGSTYSLPIMGEVLREADIWRVISWAGLQRKGRHRGNEHHPLTYIGHHRTGGQSSGGVVTI